MKYTIETLKKMTYLERLNDLQRSYHRNIGKDKARMVRGGSRPYIEEKGVI